MSTISVRYIVDDVDEAIRFYEEHFGFGVDTHPAPGFAALSRGGLRLLLNQPGAGGAGKLEPKPGGWNRFQIQVDEIEPLVEKLKAAGVRLRSEIITGKGGIQVVVEDPSGNPVELFQPF